MWTSASLAIRSLELELVIMNLYPAGVIYGAHDL